MQKKKYILIENMNKWRVLINMEDRPEKEGNRK